MPNKKTFLMALMVALVAPVASLAHNTTSETIRIQSLDSENHNILLRRPSDGKTWLLHYKSPCPLREDGLVTLTTEGDLDTGNDFIKLNYYQSCAITRAEEVTGAIHIESVATSGTSGILRDEDGERYSVYVDDQCTRIRALENHRAYIQGFGDRLSTNDILRLPDQGPECHLTYVKSLGNVSDLPDRNDRPKEGEKGYDAKGNDTQRPSAVPHVRAIPTKNGAYVYWQPATDNVGVDHYIVSHSLYRTEERYRNFEDMPNKTVVRGRSFKLENLDSDELYFIYVAAVDAAGNMSSDWSNEASAHTKSAIHTSGYERTEPVSVRVLQDNAGNILFGWSKLKALDHQTVILEANGEVDKVWYELTSNKLRISKGSRSGKVLKLTVKQYDSHGSLYEASVRVQP